jgi:hypothetical protein
MARLHKEVIKIDAIACEVFTVWEDGGSATRSSDDADILTAPGSSCLLSFVCHLKYDFLVIQHS